jgi:hypothetical protein
MALLSLRLALGVFMVAALVSPAHVTLAQEKFAIGGTPSPGQTVRLRLTQEMEADIKAEGTPPPGMPPGGVHTKSKSGLVVRLDLAALEADGRLRMDLVYEEGSQEVEVNGNAMPIASSAQDILKGKTVTMWVRGNQIVEVKVPPDFPVPADLLKQFMGPLVASIPQREMTVGQTVDVPLSLPLPVPGGTGPTPVLSGTTKTTLTKITPEGSDFVATLDQVIDAKLDPPSDPGGTRMRTTMTIAATGTTETFVKAGLVKASSMDAKLSGKFEPPAANSPTIIIDGTMKFTVTRAQ